jgi:hypothetical protein
MDVLAVHGFSACCAPSFRQGPQLLELAGFVASMLTPVPTGRAEIESFKRAGPLQRVEQGWSLGGPIEQFRRGAGRGDDAALRDEVEKIVEDGAFAEASSRRPCPTPGTRSTPAGGTRPLFARSSEMAEKLAYWQALNQALDAEWHGQSVFVLGEDVGRYSGSIVTEGLYTRYGEWRVRDTPISAQLHRAGCGRGQISLRPVVEIMTVNFALLHSTPSSTAARFRSCPAAAGVP